MTNVLSDVPLTVKTLTGHFENKKTGEMDPELQLAAYKVWPTLVPLSGPNQQS